jgi:Mg2+ and Co2+ transporter CorA
MAKDENIKISFWGMKFECTNPTSKAIIILILILIFFVALVVLLPNLH